MSRLGKNFEALSRKMQGEHLPSLDIKDFKCYYEQLSAGHTGMIREADLVRVHHVADMETLPAAALADIGERNIDKTVIIKLNGGLGTGMGMQRAKSLLTIKYDLTFLNIIVRQAASFG